MRVGKLLSLVLLLTTACSATLCPLLRNAPVVKLPTTFPRDFYVGKMMAVVFLHRCGGDCDCTGFVSFQGELAIVVINQGEKPQMQETLWHEITHVVLHEYGNQWEGRRSLTEDETIEAAGPGASSLMHEPRNRQLMEYLMSDR